MTSSLTSIVCNVDHTGSAISEQIRDGGKRDRIFFLTEVRKEASRFYMSLTAFLPDSIVNDRVALPSVCSFSIDC
jgi:hypothetical protein